MKLQCMCYGSAYMSMAECNKANLVQCLSQHIAIHTHYAVSCSAETNIIFLECLTKCQAI